MSSGNILCLEVDKSDLAHTRVSERKANDLRNGEVLMGVESFAFTASNIAYAVHGNSRDYWTFFPSTDPGWGCIPAWGFMTVEESRCEDIEEGERFFGFVPTASKWVFSPDKIDEQGFDDGAAHRDLLPGTYNRYHRLAADPTYRADYENQQLLFRPLFFTSYLITHVLNANAYHGAGQIVISSASCKTAMALSWLLRRRGLQTIALTSSSGRAFAKNSQNYDDVLLYEEIGERLPSRPTVLIDFSGRNDLCAEVHELLSANLKFCMRAGETDWRSVQSEPDPMPETGTKSMEFVTAKYLEDNDLGISAHDLRIDMVDDLLEFYGQASHWIKTVRALGAEAIQECYDRVLSGKALASEGFILSFEV